MAIDRWQQLADVLAGWPIGSGYYGTTVGMDDARDMTDALLPLLDRVAADAAAKVWDAGYQAAHDDWVAREVGQWRVQARNPHRARAAELRAPARTDKEN